MHHIVTTFYSKYDNLSVEDTAQDVLCNVALSLLGDSQRLSICGVLHPLNLAEYF